MESHGMEHHVRWMRWLLTIFCVDGIFRSVRLAYDPDLRKIPGPYLSRFTYLPLKVRVLTPNWMYYMHALQQKHRPFVRASPDEVAVADIKANREIHKIGTTFAKSAWCQNQSPTQISDETCGVFGVRDPRKAMKRRKLYQQAGNKATVVQWEPRIRSIVEETVSKIRDALGEGRVDFMRWWMIVTADVLGSLAFGEPFDVVKTESPGFIYDIEMVMKNIGIKLELSIEYWLLNTIPLPGIERPVTVVERLEAAGRKAVENTKAALKGSTPTLFSKMYAEDGEQPFSDDLMGKESANMMVAGADTTVLTLAYLVWEVLTHPDVKRWLLDELTTCSVKPNWEELDRQQYLNNVIQETLRLRPAVSTLPRQAPAQGAVLGGYKLPGGTIALTTAYITHRDPVVFKGPEQFDPDRWNKPTPEMSEAFMTFGRSARVCLGQNVSRLELLLAVSAFFQQCPRAEMAAGITWEKVRPMDVFTMLPKGGKLEMSLKG